MSLLSFEHGRAAYRADFLIYGAAVALLSALLIGAGPSGHGLALAGMMLAGLLGWTFVEYGLHRFVLHGLPPLRRWHEQHHQRPTALICTPTLLSGSLIALFVFLPVALMGDRWLACALTLGLLIGYLGYAVTHHAIHHWHGQGEWLLRRKRWHALHHRLEGGSRCFGVTSAFWDRVLRSAPRSPGVRQRTDGSAAKPYKEHGTEPLHSTESKP